MYCYVYRRKNLIEGQVLRQRAFFHLSGQVFWFQLLGAVVILLLASTCSLADKIILTDGDILEGVITRQGRSTVGRLPGAALNP
ncbi:MAG: hypothetical protein ACYTFW_24335 [Planctomycetota bacterium]|jgi:hypothetical protein